MKNKKLELVLINQSSLPMPRKSIQQWLQVVWQELCERRVIKKPQKKWMLTVVFLDKDAAKKINFQFRKKRYATDVLSFSGLEEDHLGDLILCPQVIIKQAQEHSLTYSQELHYMLLHGVLHLLGFEHENNPKAAQKMFSLQDAIFEKLLQS